MNTEPLEKKKRIYNDVIPLYIKSIKYINIKA